MIAYTGGSVAARASCTVAVDIGSTTTGTYVNTSGDLTSSSGNSSPASDTLTVSAVPVPALGPLAAVGLAAALALLGWLRLAPRRRS